LTTPAGYFTVAGTIEVEFDVQGALSQEVVEEMIRQAIADALGMPVKYVVKLTASKIGQGSGLRRLQPLQTKRYEISYEVLPPSSMDPDEVVEKANRIAMPRTVESNVFRQVLVATDGVAQIRQIASTSTTNIAVQSFVASAIASGDLELAAKLLQHDNPLVRLHAVQALGELAEAYAGDAQLPQQVTRLLEPMVKDRDSQVRMEAMQRLARLAEASIGDARLENTTSAAQWAADDKDAMGSVKIALGALGCATGLCLLGYIWRLCRLHFSSSRKQTSEPDREGNNPDEEAPTSSFTASWAANCSHLRSGNHGQTGGQTSLPDIMEANAPDEEAATRSFTASWAANHSSAAPTGSASTVGILPNEKMQDYLRFSALQRSVVDLPAWSSAQQASRVATARAGHGLSTRQLGELVVADEGLALDGVACEMET